jgi:hypothetical protein
LPQGANLSLEFSETSRLVWGCGFDGFRIGLSEAAGEIPGETARGDSKDDMWQYVHDADGEGLV